MASAMVKDRHPIGEPSDATDPITCPGIKARPVRIGGSPCALLAQREGEESRLLKSALEGGGFEVVPAEDGVAALEMICAVGPDVIVADLDHHDLDGFVLCRVLRSLSAHAMVPVLVLTRAAAGDARAMAMAALGNVRIMRTPAVPVLVVAAVSDMINIVPAVPRRVSMPRLVARPLAGAPRAVVIGG